MAKDRPINNIRVLEGERPFKLYNPEIPAGNLMLNESRLDQHQMAMNMSGYMQQQRLRQSPLQQAHQQLLQQCPPQPSTQFGYTDDYRAMNSHHSNMMANEVSLQNFIYDDLGLDSVNQMPSEPMNLHQVSSDNIMPGTSGKLPTGSMASHSGNYLSNFMAPSRTLIRNMNGPDTLSSFYDPPPLSPFTGNVYPNATHQPNTMDSAPMIPSQYPMGNSTQFPLNLRNATLKERETLPKEATGNSNFNLFKVKQEMMDAHCSTSADSLSPSSVHSPSSSDAGASDTLRGPSKRPNSDSSSPSTAASTSHGARDPTYLEKRKKNNESAKRCREARRRKEGLLAMRIVSLEEENLQLRTEVCLLDRELEDLRARLFT